MVMRPAPRMGSHFVPVPTPFRNTFQALLHPSQVWLRV